MSYRVLSIQLASLEVLKAENEDEEPEEQRLLVSGTPKAVEHLGLLTDHGWSAGSKSHQRNESTAPLVFLLQGRKVIPMWPLQDFCMHL